MTTKPENHTDIKTGGLIDLFLPPSWSPYAHLMRLDRPIGWWLLLLPAWWSIALASGGIVNMGQWEWFVAFLFLVGSIVMRGAGCVINDLWDRDIDKKVERTASRPIASGIVSPKKGLLFLLVLLLIGAAILLTLNQLSIILGLCVLPLIVLYPLMKRITFWPQAFLGITFNFGALMGWSAIAGEISFSAILLYVGGIFWTLGYDTIYAHQDKEDDVLAGVKSTALKFGSASKYWVFGFYILAFKFFALAILSVSGSLWGVGLLILPLIHMAWQLEVWQMDNPENSLKIFKSNRIFGILILLCCLV